MNLKKTILFLMILIGVYNLNAQSSCSEMMKYVKSKGYGSSFSSFGSDAISKVTFYEITDENYKRYYYAIVQFTSSYKEYIYQVASNTKSNYSRNYMSSAGKAFWSFIQPYNENLGCAPDFN
tara:strand:+ start:1330 stop:1695 length:366 start_codon:yes stop_codon:yes gene_type:complete